MKTIWKYTLEPECSISMPAGAELLAVREQRDEICLWALVDPEAPKELRHFVVYGMGQDITQDDGLFFLGMAYLGAIPTVPLVFHVFERWGSRSEGETHANPD